MLLLFYQPGPIILCMIKYIKLLRVKHYIKNLLVFLPLFFGGAIFDIPKLINTAIGFVCFCLISSSIYIWNDYKDIEKDKKHPTKKNRPLASGQISKKTALIIMLMCILLCGILLVLYCNIYASLCILIYFVLNVAYSMGLKNVPIIDISILASGFVIRTFFGGFVSGVEISQWLFLVITTGSLYMGLGKRRNEIRMLGKDDTREVLKHYTVSFLDKNMYVCVALANVFYALWTLEMPNPNMRWTIPFFIIILMCYSLNTEGDSDGDPVEVILKDKVLIILGLIYAALVFFLVYMN